MTHLVLPTKPITVLLAAAKPVLKAVLVAALPILAKHVVQVLVTVLTKNPHHGKVAGQVAFKLTKITVQATMHPTT